MSSADGPDAIAIRTVSPADLQHWLPLWQGYQAFYKAAITPDATDSTWARFLDSEEPVWAALAWRGGSAFGLVHWTFHRSTWTTGNYCYLQDLFVDPAVRGGGVGRRLIAHVYGEAERAGSPRVYWLTHETNSQAMELYDKVAEKSGFVQYRKQI